MSAIRTIAIHAPSIEVLTQLVEGAQLADLALASTPRLDDLVGGDWGAFESFDISVDDEVDRTATYHTLDGFAAMDFALRLQRIDGEPLDVTVTVTASVIGGTPRLITVDRAPVMGARADDHDFTVTLGAEDFLGDKEAVVIVDDLRRSSPVACAHLDDFGLGLSGIRSITVTATEEGLAKGLDRTAKPNPFDDVYAYEAEVTVDFRTMNGGTVTTDFDARVSVILSDGLLIIQSIDFLASSPAALPGSGIAPLGSESNPVVVREIPDSDPEEDAVIVHLLTLGLDDFIHLSSPMLDVAVCGYDARRGEWKGITSATISPIRGTMCQTPDHIEIDAMLTVVSDLSCMNEIDVVVRLKAERDGFSAVGIARRSIVAATGIAGAETVHVVDAGEQGAALVEAIERLDSTSLFGFTSTEVDLAIGHWSDIDRAHVVVACGSVTLADDAITAVGTLTAITVHGDRIERPVLITHEDPTDDHSVPVIDLLP